MSGSDLSSGHNQHNTIESQLIRMRHSIMIELQPLNIQTDKNQSYGQLEEEILKQLIDRRRDTETID